MELVWPGDNMGETEWDIAPPFLHVRVHSTKMQKGMQRQTWAENLWMNPQCGGHLWAIGDEWTQRCSQYNNAQSKNKSQSFNRDGKVWEIWQQLSFGGFVFTPNKGVRLVYFVRLLLQAMVTVAQSIF